MTRTWRLSLDYLNMSCDHSVHLLSTHFTLNPVNKLPTIFSKWIPFCLVSLDSANLKMFSFPRIYIMECHRVQWHSLMWIQGQEPPIPIHKTLGKYPQEAGTENNRSHHSLKCRFFSLCSHPTNLPCFLFLLSILEKAHRNKVYYSNDIHCALKVWLSRDGNPFKNALHRNRWGLVRYKALGYLQRQTGKGPGPKPSNEKLTHHRYNLKVDFTSAS